MVIRGFVKLQDVSAWQYSFMTQACGLSRNPMQYFGIVGLYHACLAYGHSKDHSVGLWFGDIG